VHPSAPSGSDDNGFIVVPATPQTSIDSSVQNVVDLLTQTKQEEINRLLNDISSGTDAALNQLQQTIVAEADSSSSHQQPSPPLPAAKASTGKSSGTDAAAKKAAGNNSTDGCSLCPYYLLAMNRLSKVEVPPKVKDLLLWKDVKLTGALFGSSFVLLISLAAFSFLTVISTLFLTALTLIGAYRFYLGLIFRIKGTQDNTFEKLSAHDLSLPKDKVQKLANLLENDANRAIQTLKSIILWDNITTSIIAYIGFYVVYCIGCWFNTITLFILALVAAFTLPKVYDVYKVQIDQTIEKATSAVHGLVKQVMVKIPMLNNKKKTQ
jgi:ABC-type multidrug transport system fused ATPase/permease subunit